MANQTVGINVVQANPYTYTLTASGTIISSDIELVINLTNVTSKEQVLIALDMFKEIFTVQSAVAPPI
jgi:hypothetical protein